MPRGDVEKIRRAVVRVRGQNVMLDSDLAALYGVDVKILNQAVKRNRKRFPLDFMFQLTRDEAGSLRSQIVTLDIGRGRPANTSRRPSPKKAWRCCQVSCGASGPFA